MYFDGHEYNPPFPKSKYLLINKQSVKNDKNLSKCKVMAYASSKRNRRSVVVLSIHTGALSHMPR